MKARGRAFQKQRGNWNNSPRRGQNFGFANRDASNAVTPENGSSLGDISHWDISLTRIFVVVAFTLLDEARQTSHHDNSFWSRNVQLRKKPVAFISSGSHDPLVSPQNDTEDVKDVNTKDSDTKDTDIKDSDDKTFDGKDSANKDSDNNDTHIRDTDVRDTHIQDPEVKDADVEDTYIKDPEVKDSDSKDFENTNFENRDADNITNSSKDTSNEQPAVQDVSSSDEVIVFKGRNALKRKTQTPEITLVSMQTEIRAVEEQLSVTSKEPGIHHTEEEEDSDNLLWPKKKLNKARRRRGWRDDTEEDDAMLADYIANMREHGEMMVDEEDDDDSEGTATDEAEAEDDPEEDPDHPESRVNSASSSRRVRKEKPPVEDTTTTYMHSFTELEYLEEQTDFDLMDWGRPSLRRKKGKAARLQLLGEDIDSDLEEKLQAAYSNDRQKKAQRKQEREELRAMGLLGKRGQLDLRVKYPTGITTTQVADEIKTFLAGSQEMRFDPATDG